MFSALVHSLLIIVMLIVYGQMVNVRQTGSYIVRVRSCEKECTYPVTTKRLHYLESNTPCTRCPRLNQSLAMDDFMAYHCRPCQCDPDSTIYAPELSIKRLTSACPRYCQCDTTRGYCGMDPCNCSRRACKYKEILMIDCRCFSHKKHLARPPITLDRRLPGSQRKFHMIYSIPDLMNIYKLQMSRDNPICCLLEFDYIITCVDKQDECVRLIKASHFTIFITFRSNVIRNKHERTTLLSFNNTILSVYVSQHRGKGKHVRKESMTTDSQIRTTYPTASPERTEPQNSQIRPSYSTVLTKHTHIESTILQIRTSDPPESSEISDKIQEQMIGVFISFLLLIILLFVLILRKIIVVSNYKSYNSRDLFVQPWQSKIEAVSNNKSYNSRSLFDQLLRSKIKAVSNYKSYNSRDLFDQPWQSRNLIDSNGGVIETDFSDVSLQFRNGAISPGEETFVKGSIFTDTFSLKKKFKLNKEDNIVAPVPEYHMTDITNLSDYAVITIPHCMGSNSKYIRVRQFQRNSGGVVLRDVPKLYSMWYYLSEKDMYYTDDNDGYIRVYTKHFSGIVCTCKRNINFDLKAVLYSKFGRSDRYKTMTLKMFVCGPLLSLRDFQKARDNEMTDKGYHYVEERELDLIEKQENNSSLQFRIYLTGKATTAWHHVRKETQGNNEQMGAENREEVIFHEIQTKKISDMIKCDNPHELHSEVEWYLYRTDVSCRRVCLYIDIINIFNRNDDATYRRDTRLKAEIAVPGEVHKNTSLVIYKVIDTLSGVKLTRLVRLLRFAEKVETVPQSEIDGQENFWFTTLYDVAKETSDDFQADIVQQLERIEEQGVANDVKALYEQ